MTLKPEREAAFPERGSKGRLTISIYPDASAMIVISDGYGEESVLVLETSQVETLRFFLTGKNVTEEQCS